MSLPQGETKWERFIRILEPYREEKINLGMYIWNYEQTDIVQTDQIMLTIDATIEERTDDEKEYLQLEVSMRELFSTQEDIRDIIVSRVKHMRAIFSEIVIESTMLSLFL